MFEFLSVAFMIIYVVTGKKPIGFSGWFLFGVSWLLKTQYYLQISDFYNTTLMILAFALFSFMGLTILRSENDRVFISATSVALVSSLIYFTFAITPLKSSLIVHTTDMSIELAEFLGFNFERHSEDIISHNGKYVQIILACTGIESMALFTGITLSTHAEIRRKLMAFLISVPVIYILNLLRNVFIVSAYGGEWFGSADFSFYIAHHIISKILATLALIAISVGVFRLLPEFADLIFSIKDEVVRAWRRQH